MAPLYVYYITAEPDLKHVGVSHNPVKRVREHNTKDAKGKGQVRYTARGAGSWVLRCVVGPFWNHGANKLSQKLKTVCKPSVGLDVLVAVCVLLMQEEMEHVKFCVDCDVTELNHKVRQELGETERREQYLTACY